MSDMDEWLDEQIEMVRKRYEETEYDGPAYQDTAEAETYHAIKNGTLTFGSPEEALRVYQNHLERTDGIDAGMTGSRIRAIKRFLDERDDHGG